MKKASQFLRTHCWSIAVTLSALYCFLLGVLSIAWPLDGVDFKIFHAAGTATLHGLNPYESGVLDGQFAYPPNWVPFCVLFSLLPVPIALPIWKTLNIIFLLASVRLSVELFSAGTIGSREKSAIWCYSLIMWPTISALFTGNTPLFLLFVLLATLALSKRGRDDLAGLCFGLALIKPPLAFPVLAFLVYRRNYAVLFTGFLFSGFLCAAGIYLSGVTIQGFLEAIRIYSDTNVATSPTTVGLPHLLAGIGGMPSSAARQISFLLGIAVVFTVYLVGQRIRGTGTAVIDQEALVLLLLAGPAFFGARSYDLVFVIPAFVWFVSSLAAYNRIASIAVLFSFVLVVPQAVVGIVYKVISANGSSPLFLDLTINAFRSWILLSLLILAGTLGWRKLHEREEKFLVNANA